jgi:hypothetical protein
VKDTGISKGIGMPDNPENVELTFTQQDIELIAGSVHQCGITAFEYWQNDVNNLEKQLVAELFRDLVVRLLPYSEGLQHNFKEIEDNLSALPDEEVERLKGVVKKSSLDDLEEALREF